MKLEPMRYKGYIWKYNPKQISVTSQRNVKEIPLPSADSSVKDLGGMKRIVKGIGEFFGVSCMDDFEELRMVLHEGGSGYLSIPKMEPFLAAFKYLEMIEKAEPDIISYSFEFWETDEKGAVPYGYSPLYHTVEERETLWDVAYKYEKDILELLKKNTYIKRPDTLAAGDKVRII